MPKTPINKAAPDWWPDEAMPVCRLADMPEGSARGFTLYGKAHANGETITDEKLDIIIWRPDADDAHIADDKQAENLRGFVNKCPHLGLPLETFPDRFLDALGSSLICSAHGAQFDAQGHCFAGPCQGENLIDVPLRVEMRDDERFIVIGKREKEKGKRKKGKSDGNGLNRL